MDSRLLASGGQETLGASGGSGAGDFNAKGLVVDRRQARFHFLGLREDLLLDQSNVLSLKQFFLPPIKTLTRRRCAAPTSLRGSAFLQSNLPEPQRICDDGYRTERHGGAGDHGTQQQSEHRIENPGGDGNAER